MNTPLGGQFLCISEAFALRVRWLDGGIVSLAISLQGPPLRTPLRVRLCMAWHCLRRGRPMHQAEVLLAAADAEGLATLLRRPGMGGKR